MTKLVRVDNPNIGRLRVEGSLVHFDRVVPIFTAANVIARVYQNALGQKGIATRVYINNTTDTPRFRSYAIYAEGVTYLRNPWPAPLFEVVGGEQDGEVYTFSKCAQPENLDPDKRAFLDVDRVRMFDNYVGRELTDIVLNQQ